MGSVIYANHFAVALAREVERRWESLDEDARRLLVELADETEDYADCSGTSFRDLERAGLIEVGESSWRWTTVGSEVAAIAMGVQRG